MDNCRNCSFLQERSDITEDQNGWFRVDTSYMCTRVDYTTFKLAFYPSFNSISIPFYCPGHLRKSPDPA